MTDVISWVWNHTNLSVTLSVSSVYFAYYVLFVAKRPQLACGSRLGAFLRQSCPVVTDRYWPTFWCIEARCQTVIRTLLKSSPILPYQKEFLELLDGGHVAIDWLQNEKSSFAAKIRPTVLILPGLTGSSSESYVLHFAQQVTDLGYRCLVFNYRGNGGAELKTPRTYCATSTEDLSEVITLYKHRYPAAPLMAVGVSLGGIILTNYLAKMDKQSGLVAAMTVSVPWDVFASAKTLEEPLNKVLFNRHLTNNLVNAVKRYEAIFKDKFDLNRVYKSQSIREFDDRFTSLQFGYKSYEDYYEDANLLGKVNNIKIPLFCVNAADDPFSPVIPMEEASKSQCVAILKTDWGGHIGFMEGFFPRHQSYIDRLLAQYVDAIFKNIDTVRKTFLF